MKRRDFVVLVGGVSAGLVSLPGRSAPPATRRIGVLLLGIAYAESFRTALREELHKAGYVEGRNLVVELRSTDKLDSLPSLARELVDLKVDVIAAIYTPCALAAQQATREIPIVAVVGDFLESGLVKSLSHPGGNVTGVSLLAAESHGKCVEFFRGIFPSGRRVATLLNAADPFSKSILEQVQHAGRINGIEIGPVMKVRTLAETDAAFLDMRKKGAAAVVIQGSLASKAIADLALKRRLAAATFSRSFAEVGGLMSYGADVPESFRRSAAFVLRILRGAQPANLPVEQPTRFELVINLKTAKVLGLTMPSELLLRADQVIK